METKRKDKINSNKKLNRQGPKTKGPDRQILENILKRR